MIDAIKGLEETIPTESDRIDIFDWIRLSGG